MLCEILPCFVTRGEPVEWHTLNCDNRMAICNALLTSEFNAPRERSNIHHENIYESRVSGNSDQTRSVEC